MANTAFTDLNTAGAVSYYLSSKILPITKRTTLFYNLGTKEQLPSGESNTIQFTRYNRIPLPTSKLSEGVTPTAVKLTNSKVTAVMDQWGVAVTLTDLAILYLKHPVLQVAIDLLGKNSGETIDREVQLVLMGGTTVNYTTGTTRAGLADANVITTLDIQKAVARLRRLGAYEYDGYTTVNPADANTATPRKGAFVGVVDQAVEQDITKDTTFVNAASYSNITVLHEDEVGLWMGIRWMRSNHIPTYLGIAAPATAGSAPVGGTLVAGTTYYITVTGVDAMTGVERIVSQEASQAPGGANTAIDVTLPTLAASLLWYNASEDLTNPFTFNVYIGTVTGVTYLYGSGYAADTTVSVLSNPGAGAAPPAAPNTNVEVHLTYVFGRDAYKVTEVQALQTYLTPPGASDSDKLAQRRSVGWKLAFKSCIANQSFLVRIESGSAFNV